MNYNQYCVILAGGAENRLWPVSRESRPKQFLDLRHNGHSFISQTFDRFAKIVPEENILVVTVEKYKDIVKSQLPRLREGNLLLEPYSRHTASCVAYSTYSILKRNPEATIVVTPADHVIWNDSIFAESIRYILEQAESKEVLMTLGIHPDSPDTTYGYIQVLGGKIKEGAELPVKVKTFTEKPDKALAEIFCSSGEFYWNSGIYAWKASVIAQEMKKHLPSLVAQFKGWEKNLGTEDESKFLERAYPDSPNISIEYGVMEKTDIAWLYPADFGWADVDNWCSLHEKLHDSGDNDNCIAAQRIISQQNRNSLVVGASKQKLYAIKGLDDFIVIDTDDVLLICPKDENKIKDLTSTLGLPQYKKYR